MGKGAKSQRKEVRKAIIRSKKLKGLLTPEQAQRSNKKTTANHKRGAKLINRRSNQGKQ